MSIKNIKKVILASLVVIFIPATTFAATFSISPTMATYQKGQTYKVALYADATGEKAYTVKSEISYPANLLEIASFHFAPNWMPLGMKGYDLIDNVNGKLIKTAGYPGGLSSKVLLGTITFLAKDSGKAPVIMGAKSSILSGTNKNIAVTLPTAVFTLENKVNTKVDSSATHKTKDNEKKSNLEKTTDIVNGSNNKEVLDSNGGNLLMQRGTSTQGENGLNNATSSNIATVAGAVKGFFASKMVTGFLLLILLLLLGFFLRKKKRDEF